MHDPGHLFVVRVYGLTGLKIDIGILGGTPDDGMVWAHGTPAVGTHQIVRDHGPHGFIIYELDLGHLVRGAEAVKKVYKGYPGF
ncbi:hypothetical protein THIOM_003589 [Candidatus Thiomargarita nelsonii]|uniref:Uncharacterized protein n=1 Tax=Candidatus Thiomargarita nelsonii TaxID=1003181 RepID=A0A176RY25_9GAMM|nr:hypothetical protein THIOM_003589 [Candidatus Thiomargarita nelsonii]